VLVGGGGVAGTGVGVLVGGDRFVGTGAGVLVGRGMSVGIRGVGVGLAAHPLAAKMARPRSASRKHVLRSIFGILIFPQASFCNLAIRLVFSANGQ
jgi:hypothetical protein